MHSCKAEYIPILDAYSVPAPEMLAKTIHYFADEKIGMIQPR